MGFGSAPRPYLAILGIGVIKFLSAYSEFLPTPLSSDHP